MSLHGLVADYSWSDGAYKTSRPLKELRLAMNDQIKGRYLIIGSALLALFLGALDTLVMSAAMPTIVAELGGLHLYSWAFSVYLLCRAVSLPIFGKLADLFSTKTLFLISTHHFKIPINPFY